MPRRCRHPVRASGPYRRAAGCSGSPLRQDCFRSPARWHRAARDRACHRAPGLAACARIRLGSCGTRGARYGPTRLKKCVFSADGASASARVPSLRHAASPQRDGSADRWLRTQAAASCANIDGRPDRAAAAAHRALTSGRCCAGGLLLPGSVIRVRHGGAGAVNGGGCCPCCAAGRG